MRQVPRSNPIELSPLEQEVQTLREENRRLKGLIELREDRTQFEQFQVQSRNKLLGLFLFAFVILGGSWFYFYESRAALNQEINIRDAQIYKLKKGGAIITQ